MSDQRSTERTFSIPAGDTPADPTRAVAEDARDDALSRRDLIAKVGRTAGSAALVAAAATTLGGGRAGTAQAGAGPVPRTPGGDAGRSINTGPMFQVAAGDRVQAVVSSQELATQAGLEMLAAGGMAADAAIAIAAALSVVEPWFSSALGGGTWALYYDAEADEVTNLDGVGPVGSKATLSDYESRVDSPGIHQAILPGAWDGWMLWLDRYGRLDLGQVLTPAIRIAREGYPVGAEMALWLNQEADFILASPSSARIYAPTGALLGEGGIVLQTEQANTFLDLVRAYDDASGGSRSDAVQAARDYFYRGPLAEAIVEFSDQGGGYLTLEDFRGFEAEIVEPISIDYGEDIRVFQNVPNSQGITMLLALNILNGFDFSGLDPNDLDVIHRQVEAIKLAFADRYEYVGDPDRIAVPVADLLSDAHASLQRQRIDPDSALEWPIASRLEYYLPAHTTTFHVVDRFGNAAAVTTSLGGRFLAVGETGIHINERMQFLSLEPGNANQLEPGYKVRHTSNPYLAMRDNRPYILGGNTGVDTQPQGQVQQFMSVAELGLGAQEAVARPRFVSTAFPTTNYPYAADNTLQMEQGFPESLIQGLRERGHDVVVGEGIFGAANMIVVNQDGTDAQVGAEPRGGTASGRVIPAAR